VTFALDVQGRYRIRYRNQHLDTTYRSLKRSGAEIFCICRTPCKNAAKVIRIAANLDWHPVYIEPYGVIDATALKAAGLENALG